MKRSRKFWVGAVVASVLTAFPAAAEESLVFAGAGGSFEKIFREKILADFEKEQGVTITYVAGNSTDLVAKLQAQKGNQEIDVALIDDGPIMRAVSLGFCADLQGLDYSKLYDVARLPTNKAVGMGLLAAGLTYNTKVFKDNGWPAPTSWNDLKDPKFKGKVVIPPMNNGYGLLTVVMLARLGGGGEQNIEPGFDAMKNGVDANVLAYEPSPAKMAEMLQTEQAILGVWGTARVKTLADSGVPVDFVYPTEGAPAVMPSICPVAKPTVSPKAHALIQLILSPKVQSLLAKGVGFAPVNKEAQVESPGIMPVGPLAEKLVSADWETINKARDDWNKRWVREIER